MEKGEPGVDAAAEDIVMQQYPSPTVEGSDTAFYQRNQEMEQSGDQPEEPPTPPQRPSRPDVNAEDLQLTAQGDRDDQIQQLQLAAQMSRALSGVVGDTNTDEDTFDNADPDIETLQQSLREDQDPVESHEQSLPQDLQDNLQQNIHQNIQQNMHGLRQLIPNAEPSQPHQHIQHAQLPQHQHQHQHQHQQYMPNPTQQPHSISQHIAMGQYPISDATPPRKRSKVSRACDECRRKKVKCDAGTEGVEETCSNCRRSGMRCMFSRVPQKRGPSKGYIKELADRIHSIEGKLGSQGAAEALAGELAAARRESAGSYSPSAPPEDNSRKRPYSNISGESFNTPTPNNRPASWAAEYRPPISQQLSYNANGMALKPILPRESSIAPPQPPQHAPVMDGLPIIAPSPPSTQVRIIDNSVYDGYVNIIHHDFPFLPSSKAALDSSLSHCSMTLRDAFIEALNATMESFAVPGAKGDARVAIRLLTDWEAETGQSSTVSDLIRLQCLILLIIRTDNYGPTFLKGQQGGSPKASLIGRAAGVAYAMSLPQDASNLDMSSDLESESCIRIRAWWTLVILDRWNAIGSANPLIISNDTVTLSANLKGIVGEANYRFVLLAYIMGHWVPASVTAPVNSTPGAGANASASFNLNMEMWRLDFPTDIDPGTHPVLHLAYWHCRLLAFLFMPSALSTDVAWAVRDSVALLTENYQMLNPLNHHFTSLTALCLLEMLKVPKTRDEALQLLLQLIESNIAPSAWDTSIRDKIVEATRPLTSSGPEATASQSLQHLADLATASEVVPATGVTEKTDDLPKFRVSDSYDDLGFDPRPMLRSGYLNAVAIDTS